MDFFTAKETCKVTSICDPEPDAFCHQRLQLISCSGQHETNILILGENFEGNFQKVTWTFLSRHSTEENHEVIKEWFRPAVGFDRRNTIVDNGNFSRIGVVMIDADFFGVMTDRNDAISFLKHLLLEIVNPTMLVRPGSVVTEGMNVENEGLS